MALLENFKKVKIIPIFVFLIFAMPIAVIVRNAFLPSDAVWPFVFESILLESSLNTFFLMFWVLLFSSVAGLVLAVLTSFFRYPGRRIFHILFVLPIILPTYVTAFVFLSIFDVHTQLGSLISDFIPKWAYILRSTPVAALVLSSCFYPYFYLFFRSAFITQEKRYFEMARIYGYSHFQVLRKLALPLSKPWVLSAALIVAVEVASEFGASYIFNLETLSVSVYKTWFSLFSFASACRLALVLMMFCVVFIFLSRRNMKVEFFSKSRLRYYVSTSKTKAWLLSAGSFVWVLATVCLPLSILAINSVKVLLKSSYSDGYNDAINSFLLAGSVATVATVLAFSISYYKRKIKQDSFGAGLIKWPLVLCFAVPGVVMAAAFHALKGVVPSLYSFNSNWIFASIIFLVIGLVFRFSGMAFSNTDPSFTRIFKNNDRMVSMLNLGFFSRFFKVYVPLALPGIISAWTLVFVEVIKEVPMTLMNRPAGFSTLSVRIFELISEGEWGMASLPSFILVFLGLAGMFVVNLLRSNFVKAKSRD